MSLWKGTPGDQPADPCAVVVSGGHVETNATFLSFHSEFGVELDGERLSNGQAKVTMVANDKKGVKVMVGVRVATPVARAVSVAVAVPVAVVVGVAVGTAPTNCWTWR